MPRSPSQAGSKPGDSPLQVYLIACGLSGPRGFESPSRRHSIPCTKIMPSLLTKLLHNMCILETNDILSEILSIIVEKMKSLFLSLALKCPFCKSTFCDPESLRFHRMNSHKMDTVSSNHYFAK